MLEDAFLLVAENIEEDPGEDCSGKNIPGGKVNKARISHRPARTPLS